jgi:hypothetical protein
MESFSMGGIRGLDALLAKDTVNLRNPQDVELWTHTLNIYTSELVTAVAAVGNSTARVLEYLRHRAVGERRGGNRNSAPRPDAD